MVIMGNLLIKLESIDMLSSLDQIKKNISNEYVLNISKELVMNMLQTLLKKQKTIDKGILISDNMIHVNYKEILVELMIKCDALTREQFLNFLTQFDCEKEVVEKTFDIWRAVKRVVVLCKYAIENNASIVFFLI